MKQLKLSNLLILLGCLFMFSCNNDDSGLIDFENTPFPIFEEGDLNLVNNGDSATWRITEFEYSFFANDGHDISCIEDELFTFYTGQDTASVVFGDVSCFEAPKETKLRFIIYHGNTPNLSSLETETTILSQMVLGFAVQIGNSTAGSASLYHVFSLLEASEDRLKFVLGNNAGTTLGENYDQYMILDRVN